MFKKKSVVVGNSQVLLGFLAPPPCTPLLLLLAGSMEMTSEENLKSKVSWWTISKLNTEVEEREEKKEEK